jgi:hypothetical protein
MVSQVFQSTKRFTVKSDERVSIVGRTGSGKTYLAQKLTANLKRLVVCDPKGTLARKWDLRDWSVLNERRLRDGADIRLRIPTPLDGNWEQYFKACYDAGNLTLYIDEAYGVLPRPGAQPTPFLNALYTRGRELGIGVWASTQRPSWIPLIMLSEADWFFVFRLMLVADRMRLAEVIGPSAMDVPKSRYGFWFYNVHWDHPLYHRGL